MVALRNGKLVEAVPAANAQPLEPLQAEELDDEEYFTVDVGRYTGGSHIFEDIPSEGEVTDEDTPQYLPCHRTIERGPSCILNVAKSRSRRQEAREAREARRLEEQLAAETAASAVAGPSNPGSNLVNQNGKRGRDDDNSTDLPPPKKKKSFKRKWPPKRKKQPTPPNPEKVVLAKPTIGLSRNLVTAGVWFVQMAMEDRETDIEWAENVPIPDPRLLELNMRAKSKRVKREKKGPTYADLLDEFDAHWEEYVEMSDARDRYEERVMQDFQLDLSAVRQSCIDKPRRAKARSSLRVEFPETFVAHYPLEGHPAWDVVDPEAAERWRVSSLGRATWDAQVWLNGTWQPPPEGDVAVTEPNTPEATPTEPQLQSASDGEDGQAIPALALPLPTPLGHPLRAAATLMAFR